MDVGALAEGQWDEGRGLCYLPVEPLPGVDCLIGV
jgi:hypothetical protein